MPEHPQTVLVVAIFGVVYLGMILGGLPRLHLDRTGVALLGAIAIVGFGVMTPEDAARAVHLPTILLLFALRKFKNTPGQVTTSVTAHMERNEAKRLRVGGVDVVIQFDSPADSMEHLDRVLDQFEDFCVVTQSVRSGFPVNVTVRDGAGRVLKGG